MSEVYYIIGSDYCEGVHVPDIVSLLLPPPLPISQVLQYASFKIDL